MAGNSVSIVCSSPLISLGGSSSCSYPDRQHTITINRSQETNLAIHPHVLGHFLAHRYPPTALHATLRRPNLAAQGHAAPYLGHDISFHLVDAHGHLVRKFGIESFDSRAVACLAGE
jgi:hypothetical protein